MSAILKKNVKDLELHELVDKVAYIKGRVWTIYATTGKCESEGVWVFQGVKPYPNFKFDSVIPYHREKYQTSFFSKETVIAGLIEGDEIDKRLKQMEREDKKKLNRKKAIDFYVHLTGHTKSFISRKIEENFNSFQLIAGAIRYDLWKCNGALSLSHNIHGHTNHAYFDFITFKSHSHLNEKHFEDIKEEIIDQYKEWKGID